MPEPKRTDDKPQPVPGFGRGPGPMFQGPKVRAKDTRRTATRLWRYLQHQGSSLIGVVLLVIASTGMGLAGPYLMGRAVDRAILKGNLVLLGQYAVSMLAVYLVASAASGLQTVTMARVTQYTVRDLRNDLFSKLQTLPLAFFDRSPHGELMSRVTNDIDNISMVLAEGVTQFVSSILTLVGVTVLMLAINWRLAIVSMVTIPPLIYLSKRVASASLASFREQQDALGALNGILEESVTGARVVQAYVRQEKVIDGFEVENRRLLAAATRAQILAGTMGPIMNLINNTGFAVVAGAGGWMAVEGVATVGTIAVFLNYARQLSMPLNQIANLYNSIQSALAGAERVFSVMDEAPEAEDVPDAVSLRRAEGDVIFDDVCFAYEEGRPVLEHVSLHAQPGQTFALVGPTGAGKTTIVNLLSRFYEVQSGAIRVDGYDVRSIEKDGLRQQLGAVLQDSFLFSDTVKQNIRYGRLDATDTEVMAAAALANAHSFIERLPQGYETMLTERGSNLSQGQRQLLAIARAVLADPGILVLDEATSSVDTRTEMHIQEAMLRLMQGRTCFVIAHRLSTIRDADRILVIDRGKVVEQGTHQELLAAQGFYYRLYQAQFAGQTI
jgi:ATP-binding cassette, subfamily B, multidrug efflux pump